MDDHNEVLRKVFTLVRHFLQRVDGVFSVEVENPANGLSWVSVPQVPAFCKGGDDFEGEGGLADFSWADHEGQTIRHKPRIDEIVLDSWEFGVR